MSPPPDSGLGPTIAAVPTPRAAPRCRICGAATVGTFTLGATELVSCRSCSAVFTAAMPSEEELRRYYEHDYTITTNMPDLAVAEHRRVFRLPEQVKLIADIRRIKPPPASVLDIGCDRAFFLDEIRRYGYEVRGVEPSATAREYCRRIGIEVAPTLDDLGGESFDVVVLWHALEHFTDPTGLVRAIGARLNPDGLIVVRVPAFDSAWRRLLGSRWIWFQPRNHYFHYSAEALRTLLERGGFEVLQVKRQRPNDRLTGLAHRLAKRIYGRYLGYHPTLRRTLGRIYEDVTGVELYAIGRKRAPSPALD